MDEVLRDLVVIGLIALVCFAGAVEYVYWRLGFDKIVGHLHAIELCGEANRNRLDFICSRVAIKNVA